MIHVEYAEIHKEEKRFTGVSRPEGSGGYLLLYFEEPMHVILGEEIVSAEKGGILIYPPGDPQNYSAVHDFRLSSISFTASWEDIAPFRLPVGEVFYPEKTKLVEDYLLRIQEEYFTGDFYYEEALDSLIRQLFIYLAREIVSEELPSQKETRLYNLFLQARYMMLSNCEREWASTNIPGMVSLSKSQFYKYYNDFFGISPMADLQRARIEKAKQLLTDRNLTVTEVSKRCGYASIHHFSRTFKEHVGMSPLQYVKTVKWM